MELCTAGLGSLSAVSGAAASAESETDDTAAAQDLTQYIDMGIGSLSGNSHTVIGPQRPNASVSPSPDTNPQNSCTGYDANGDIRGFSQIHVSGTGVGKYGNFLISPQVGLSTRLDGHDSAKENENATCSEYSVTLSRYNIDCSFTPAEHSTIYKFTYPAADDSSLLIDLAHNITNVNATSVSFSIETNDEGQTVITGQGYYEGGEGPSFSPGGWGEGYTLYFYAVVDRAADVIGVYDKMGAHPGVTSMESVDVTDRLAGLGTYMTFDTAADDVVSLKMGVSFKSVDQAKTWLDEEIPAWDYDAVKEETERQWNEELNKIVIDDSVSDTDKQLFYTSIYHAHVMPRDRTGDYDAYGSADVIDDHLASWDTWRTLYPLYTITNPDLVAKTINSFISRSEVNGYVRDSFVAGKEMYAQQGGDNVDNIIAEAYLKGIDGVDWDAAYQVVKNDAENLRLDWQGWNSVTAGDSYYKSLGWIPGDDDNVDVSTCSYQLEYAYNDYCAAQLAKGMGDTANYTKWLKRSNSWTNIWNADVSDSGYSGFIWPKSLSGSWILDSSMKTPAAYQSSWTSYFYEATSWNYSFFVPQDIPQLIEKMGGEETFCDRLTTGIERGWIDFGNEPAFLAPYLFSYTSKPYLTTDSIAMLRTKFTLDGVPGNDDSGAMSSWYIFSSIGFFPNAGQNLYYFTSPCYPETTIHLDNGNSLKIIANNRSDTNCYIQSVTINGEPYYSTMFTHDVITNGGEIVFEMGSAPVDYTDKDTVEAACTVSFDAMGGSNAASQTVRPGALAAEPTTVEKSGYTLIGWYADEELTAPWNFETDTVTDSITLYAKWTMNRGAAISGISLPDDNTVIDLSQYDDWIHFGDSSQGVIHIDRKNLSAEEQAFGTVTNYGNGREENELNTNQPFSFTWSDGTPTAAQANKNQYFSWTRNGLDLSVTVPAGTYQGKLYLSGIRARGTIEILNEDGTNVVQQQELWSNTGTDRQYRVVSLNFNNDAAATYTIRLRVDLNNTEPENYSMAIAAATLRQSDYNAVAEAESGGSVSVRGGSAQQVGDNVTVTAIPEDGYQFAGWEAEGDVPDLDRPLQNPVTFTMPAQNVRLKATFTKYVVSVTDTERVPRLSRIDLSDASNLDWAYLGQPGSIIQKADVSNSVFTSTVTADSGSLTDENMDNTTKDSPYFSWSGGTPVETGQDVRTIIWSASGMTFDLSFQPGEYETSLYLSGIRAGAIVEVLDENGTVLLSDKICDCMQNYRFYRKVTLRFACDTAQTFTVHYKVDSSDTYADWYSVALYAATVAAVEDDIITGDVDGDSRVTVSDVVELRDVIMKGGPTADQMRAADFEGNGALTVSDVVDLRDYIMKGGN